MPVLTADEMREADRAASEDYGIPPVLLMEHAAICLCRVIRSEFPAASTVAVICGRGNNGGDGMAAARILRSTGLSPRIAIVGDGPMSRLAELNFALVKKTGSAPVMEVGAALDGADLVVDAIFGTGFRGAVSGAAAAAVDMINASGLPVVSMDVPSGLNCDTGRVSGACVRADMTVTAAYAKRGFFLYPGSELRGRLFIADIGIPDCADSACSYAEAELLAEWMPRRRRNDWKGSTGRLLVLAGSRAYTGAPAFVCRAAMRCGCGMVYLAVPEEILPVMQSKLDEVVIVPYGESDYSALFDLMDSCDAAAFGPGLGGSEFARGLLASFAKGLRIPAVADADALRQDVLDLRDKRFPLVITPHAGEAARLCDGTVQEILKNPPESALALASRFGCAAVLKGPNSIVALPENYFYFNLTGSEALATAGSGDVLTGVVGALLARGLSAEESAVLGCFMHGAAGDAAAKRLGRQGVIASDVIESLPGVASVLESGDPDAIGALMGVGRVSACL